MTRRHLSAVVHAGLPLSLVTAKAALAFRWDRLAGFTVVAGVLFGAVALLSDE